MHIKDGSNYSYHFGKEIPFVYSFGWIGDKVESTKWQGEKFKQTIIDKLKENEIFCNGKRGFHYCQICGEAMGNREIWIAHNKKCYVAPNDIVHYIEKHDYRPDDELLNAILLGKYLSNKQINVSFINTESLKDYTKSYSERQEEKFKELKDMLNNQ
jgi:hypothetical protein